MLKTSVALFSSLLLLSSSALAVNSRTFSPVNPENPLNLSEIAQVDDPDTRQNILDFAQKITVQVITDNNKGSGTLIGQQGNTYLVLTNAHVVNYGKTFTIKTHDGKIHSGKIEGNTLPDGYDLALLKFTSEQEYTIAQAEDITVPKQGNMVFTGGYVAETGEFRVTEGKITEIPTQQFKEGYNIGYTNDIDQGMSGGPIITSQMLLVGINGRSAAPILNTGYTYQNGKPPTEAEIKRYRQLSWGIPINTILTYIKPDILTAYGLPLPQGVASIETSTYTGYIAELEAKARKFVVRIDSSSKANGSGVIIAKEGNIYTVLTADHVLCEKPIQGVLNQPCFADYTYTVTTHDGKTRELNESTIIRQEGVDLAIFKFESSDNYPVAEIANYKPKEDDYIFVAGFPKVGNNPPKWMFSSGLVYDQEQGLLNTRQSDYNRQNSERGGGLQSASSLTGGYELVYTSITYGGMSGAPVLDAQGRVIGIHGRAEGAAKNSITQLGYSLGIPINTFIGLQNRFKVNPESLTTERPQISNQEKINLDNSILGVEVPNTNATANIWIERGGQLWRLRKYDEAIKAFDEAIKQKNPDNLYLAYYGKGLTLYAQAKSSELTNGLNDENILLYAATEAFKQSVEANPNYAPAWAELALTYYERRGDWHKAGRAISKAIELEPNNPNFYFYQIRYLNRRNFSTKQVIEKAIAIAPRASFYLELSSSFWGEESLNPDYRLELAIAQASKTIQLNPTFADAYYLRAFYYEDQEKWNLAEADYNKVIQLYPNQAESYHKRAEFYKSQNKYELARADYNRAVIVDPNNPEAYYQRAEFNLPSDVYYEETEKWKLVEADYNKVIELYPNQAEPYYKRAEFYSQLRVLYELYDREEEPNYKLPEADYTKVIQLFPNRAEPYYRRAKFYESELHFYKSQKIYDLAEADYSKVIQLFPNDATAYIMRAEFYRRQDKFEKGEADYRKAIQLETTPRWIYYYRIASNEPLAKWNLVEADCDKLIQLFPNDIDGYLARVDVYERLEKLDLAESDYSKIIELSPNDSYGYFRRAEFYKEKKNGT